MRTDFKVVDSACEEFQKVEAIFNSIIANLYGSQKMALEKIGSGSDRLCEMLFVDDVAHGVIVYKKSLQKDKSLELKTLCLLEPDTQSKKGLGTILLNRVMETASRRGAEKILVTVSSKSPALAFFQRKGFAVTKQCPDLYIKGSTENILECPVENKPKLSEQKSLSTASEQNNSTLSKPSLEFSRRKNPSERSNGVQPSTGPDICCTLKRQYIDAIRNGFKTYEGRVATNYFNDFTVGKTVDWHAGNTTVSTRIKSRKKFSSFKDMLTELGYEKFVPEARNLEEAIFLYDRIPGYADKVKRFGALALELEVIAPRLNNTERGKSYSGHSYERQEFSRSYQTPDRRSREYRPYSQHLSAPKGSDIYNRKRSQSSEGNFTENRRHKKAKKY